MLLLARMNTAHEPAPVGPEFESSRLLSLQPRPEIKITELKMP